MKTITEKMKVHEEWYKLANEQDMKTLPKFLKHLLNDYDHDYGTICHALTAGAIATCWAMNKDDRSGGITGFQAGAIMWEFIRNWMHDNNKCGLKLLEYDHMLYPQYQYSFEKTISTDTWIALQKRAKELIKESPKAHPDVKKHWKQVEEGIVPFEYKIKND
jgi:hypothetical protein